MKVNARVAKNILHSLSGGTVPDNGLQYIAVGRKMEVIAVTNDMDKIADGYSTFRLLEGAYGTGKSFMAKLIKNEALLRGFVVAECELAPERKLCGTKKEGLETYRYLLATMSTKTSPSGNALEEILDTYVYESIERAKKKGCSNEQEILSEMQEESTELRKLIEGMPHGFDFYTILNLYRKSYLTKDYETKNSALRWFRGEYNNKSEAKAAIRISNIITDADWFSYIKIWAILVHELSYTGLYIILDELTQITRNIVNATTREHNFERLLSMYNDCYGNDAKYMGIILCGIPSSIHDTKRGIFSYEALRSRLSNSNLQGEDILEAPIIKLSMLTPEEFMALIEKLESMHASLQDKESYFTAEERIQFVNHEYRRVAAEDHLTPREFIRDFLTVLDLKSTSKREYSMTDFLSGAKGIQLSKSMIGTIDMEGEVSAKYEAFSL